MYDLVWFWDNPNPENNPWLGRWLGVAHRVRSDLRYWILNENGDIMDRTTVQHVTDLDRKKPQMAENILVSDEALDVC
jgi:hypothetical protein